MRHGCVVLLLLAVLLPTAMAVAADDVGRVKVTKGEVGIERAGQKLPASVGMKLLEGDVIVTGRDGSAGVTFNARDGEVIAPDAVWNGLFTFLKPELFKRTAAGSQ